MPGQFSDSARPFDVSDNGVPPPGPLVDATPSSSRRRHRSDWRLGGRAVQKWDALVLAVAFLGLGAGVLGAGLANAFVPGTPILSTVALWLGMIAALAFAFIRGRPAGLLRARSTDALWGLGFGLLLRALEGWVTGADASAFPSTLGAAGAPDPSWWPTVFFPAGFFGPFVEEFFFRAVLLVTVYQVLRRSVGHVAAAATALLVSAGVFVVLHGMRGVLPLNDGLMYFAVGAVCGLVVLLTGRLWGAVLVHVVYNVSYLVLVVAGVALG